jgi:hypothetical protein
VASTEYHSKKNQFFIGNAAGINRGHMMRVERSLNVRNPAPELARAVYVCEVWEATGSGKLVKTIMSTLSDCSVHWKGTVVQVEYAELCSHISRAVDLNEQMYTSGKAIRPGRGVSRPVLPINFGSAN